MNLLERLLAMIWDPTGRRRRAMAERHQRLDDRERRLRIAQHRAADQIKRTQAFVRSHRGQFG